MKDIVPELLSTIEQEFDKRVLDSDKIKKAVQILYAKKATYRDANEFAIEIGEILADVLGENITAEILPDGKMYYNIAERILSPSMSKNHELITGYAADIQTTLNHEAGLRIKAQVPPLNQDRINGIINRLAYEEDFENIKWILAEPIVNFSQSIVDETIKANAEFQAKAGLRPKIIRREAGNCCDWCKGLVGTYAYPDVPEDVYKRHRYCRCTVDYYPRDGKKQNIHTKEWIDSGKDAKIEVRKNIYPKLSNRKFTKTKHSRIRQNQREITDEDIDIALKNPIHKEPIEVDSLGRKSQKVIGEFTTVIVNPDNMVVITTYDTKDRIRKRYISKEGDK